MSKVDEKQVITEFCIIKNVAREKQVQLYREI